MRSKTLSILLVVITISFFFATATMMAKDITSDIPKGKSLPAPYSSTINNRSGGVVSSTLIYEENFESMPNDWTLGYGWNIGQDSTYGAYSYPNSAFTNHPYNNGADYQLLSPVIQLPSITTIGTEYILSFWSWWQTETSYDNIYIDVYANGVFQRTIFLQTGQSGWVQPTIDITEFASQNIQFLFRLTADSSNYYEGWGIDDIQILQSVYEVVPELDLISINTQNFPFVYSTVSVSMEGQDMSNLVENNFQVYENGTLQTDFFEVSPPSQGTGSRLVDIAFLMDNSGSMDPYQQAVRNNVTSFINNLGTYGVDCALGLCRYGSGNNNGYPFLEDSGILTTNLNYFRDDVWLRNDVSGGYEPGYYAITYALANFNWRPGSQKILIILTDETPDQGVMTISDAMNACSANGAMLYALTTSYLFSTFTPITETTNGAVFDIMDNFNVILTEISQLVTSNYIISYRSSNPFFDGSQRNVLFELQYQGLTASAEGNYVPGQTPQITRTPETIALDNSPQVDNHEIIIQAIITDSYPPYTTEAILHYSNLQQSNWTTQGMTNLGNNLWQGTIPASAVQSPGIEYYLSATDGQSTSSLPSVEPMNYPFTIAVLPNEPPIIIHHPAAQVQNFAPLSITAIVTDSTMYVATVELSYRRYGLLTYTTIPMEATGNNLFSATIPGTTISTYGVEYYIRAVDNYGLAVSSGFADTPNFVPAILEGTIIPGGAITDFYWEIANSPYYINNTVFVATGNTLEIESGCEVIFYPNTRLEINGGIHATGVHFTGTDPQLGWPGIYLESQDQEIQFTNCLIEHAHRGLYFQNTNGTISNTTITKENDFPNEVGVLVNGYSNPHFNNMDIINYAFGFMFTNETRTSSTPSLNNTRIRNTSSTLRTESHGLDVLGAVGLTVNNADIEEYDYGVYWNGLGTTDYRSTPSLNNTRIRNTSSTLRTVTKGVKMIDVSRVTIANDSIVGYPTGLEITNDGSGLLTTTASLNNTRIRNTSSTLRTETKGINFSGYILATMDTLYVEDYTTGIYYEGNGMPFNRTTPSLNNTRIRNTSSTLREPLKGVVLKNLAGVTLQQNIIYPQVQAGTGNLEGNGIFLQTVQNAEIMHNTIWGLNNGLYATGNSNGSFIQNVIWTNGAQLNTPVILEDSNIPVSNSDISYVAGVFPGTGNLNEDPLFVAPEEGNFYLKPRSPLANQGIGALPFNFEVLAGVRTYTMHPGWNMMGVPYLTSETYSSPVSIFADDLSPFYVAPTYTSIVQLNPAALPDTLGHIDMSYTGSYIIPSIVRPGIGYWIRNPYATPATIDVYGLMDEGSYNIVLDGTTNANNGWYLLANPYDLPIGLDNGLILGEGMLAGLLKYDYSQNAYLPIDEYNPGVIEPWGGFFVKATAQNAHIYLNYPTPARQQNDNQPVINNDYNIVERPKLKWEFSLSAKAGEKGDIIILGVGEGAKDTLDPLDIPEIPNPPFPQIGMLQFSVCNNDWENNAGLYTRDIKNGRSGSWNWNLLINLENMLEDGIYSDIIRISAKGADKIPGGYIFRLVNPADGSSADLRNEDFLLDVDITNAEGEPWLIPLYLEVIPCGSDVVEREAFSASNYPNPFNPETTISYNLPSESFVTLEIYNLKGQVVNRLVSDSQPSGMHKVVWKGTDQQGRAVASGFYFYRLKTKDNQLTRKILLMK